MSSQFEHRQNAKILYAVHSLNRMCEIFVDTKIWSCLCKKYKQHVMYTSWRYVRSVWKMRQRKGKAVKSCLENPRGSFVNSDEGIGRGSIIQSCNIWNHLGTRELKIGGLWRHRREMQIECYTDRDHTHKFWNITTLQRLELRLLKFNSLECIRVMSLLFWSWKELQSSATNKLGQAVVIGSVIGNKLFEWSCEGWNYGIWASGHSPEAWKASKQCH